MKLWPSSLLGRNALLIVAIVLLGQLGGAWLLREMVLKPRLEQLADAVARNAAGLQAGLEALSPAQRAEFVAAFNARELASQPAQVPPDSLGGKLLERRPLSRLERSFVQSVSQRISALGGQAQWRRQGGGRLELRLAMDGGDYWIVLPGLPVAREFSGAFLMATAGSVLIALLGALWLQRRLNRPLARVERAARELAAGRQPQALPEDGPREVATVSRSFNQLVSSLAQTERERALMLAGVSHDLRTPLTKLRLGVEILGDRTEPELAASMKRSMEEMDAIVTQFLDFARDGQEEPLSQGLLHELAADVAAAFGDHGRHIAIEGAEVPAVALRPQALRRVVVNLVENAFRHGRPPVSIATGSDSAQVWMEICDSGSGIALDQAEVLKQPFRRAEGARSGVSGAGLGLAIADRIVAQHGGRLALTQARTGGLCARISLPRQR